jgi:hypothetical protein
MPTKPKPEKVTLGPSADPALSQIDKFQKAARDLGTDDDPERFKERVRKVGSAKPAPATGKRNAKPG